MNPRARMLPAALTAAALSAATLAACSSSPSPPAWCTPLAAQFSSPHARQANLTEIGKLKQAGAPVGELAADYSAFVKLTVTAGDTSPGAAGYTAVLAEPAALAKVSADLKQLGSECGQPAGAYKTDDV